MTVVIAFKSLVKQLFAKVSFDNPIERLVIRKCKIVSLEIIDPPADHISSEGIVEDSQKELTPPKDLLNSRKTQFQKIITIKISQQYIVNPVTR